MPPAGSLADLLDAAGAIPAPKTTCAHVNRSGVRCPNDPEEDETICLRHGASITRAREANQRRLLALQSKSLTVAEDLLECGDPRVKATVMIAIMDRTGLGPTSKVEVEDKRDDLMKLTRAQLDERMERAQAALRSLPAEHADNEAQRTDEDADVTAPVITRH